MPLAGPIQLSKIYPNGLGRQNGEPGGGYRAAGAGEGKLGETPGANRDLSTDYAASLALDLRGEYILSRRPQICFLLGFGF